jgi:predicted transcriptional regulator
MSMTKLTPEQCEALDRSEGPLAVEDERTHRVYYVVDEPTLADLQRQADLAAIRDGIADMEAGRVVTLEELDSRIRARLALPSK